MDTILERFNFARRELLDLSFKNPLINFKLRRSTGLEFSNINPNEVFEYLTVENKNVSFTKDLSSLPNRLTTIVDDKEIRSRLNKTYRSSKLFLEEKGANTLFLAIGFLKWKENNGDVFYRSPLVLIPVELNRSDNSDRYYVNYNGEEIRFNISLITKMKNEFNLDIEFGDDELTSVDQYFRYLDDIISKFRTDWTLETTSGALDFFSYSKFLMYRDLDTTVWLDKKEEVNNPIIKKLFLTNFDDKLSNNVSSEELLKPRDTYTVVDADSSQLLAIYDINQGKNIVLQGPPGTGKSQTITNIIASSVAHNKSILFVSEKMAALEVVKRRLENVGLGDLVLELHSHKTNKKNVLKSIEKTLNLGEPKIDDPTALINKYQDVKRELNQYKELVNKPLRNSKLPLVEIYGEALKTKEKLDKDNIRLPRISFVSIDRWTYDDYIKRLDTANEFIALIDKIGKIEKHPLYGISLKSCLPYEQVSLKEKLNDLEDSLSALIQVINNIGGVFNNRSCNTIFDSIRLFTSIETLDKYSFLNEINCADYRFKDQDYLDKILKRCIKVQDFYLNNKDYTQKAFSDAFEFKDTYGRYKEKRFFTKMNAKKDKKILRTYLKNTSRENSKYAALYEHLEEYTSLLPVVEDFKELFLDLYRGIYLTDWKKISSLSHQVNDLLTLIDDYKVLSQTKIVIKEEDKINKLRDLKDVYQDALISFETRLEEFLELSDFNSFARFGYVKWHKDLPFNELKKVISSWKNNIDSIMDVVRYNSLIKSFTSLGIEPLLELVPSWKMKNEYLADIISFEYFDSLINYAYQKYPILNSFKKYKADRLIDLFKELDLKVMLENIKFIIKNHWDNMPKINDNTKDMSLIRREFQKKRNHMPIRKLIAKTSETIKKIKPVFMMSPISVASFLNPQDVVFDLVIFDEASQVRPVEAFGALLRAKQIVVVGDSKQLPPTSFFDALASKYDDLNDEDYDISNMESILSLLLAKNIPQRTLNWHYRSHHQSLIMLSNNEFYQQSLKVFPSVNDRDLSQGLIFNYLPKTCYSRGSTRTNRLEAREVIKAVMEHAKNSPHLSLGVASFSLAQQEELYKEFESQMKKITDPDIKNYFLSHKEEPFFIKNLENVQGDERDVIFISIGYGYDEKRNITMDFGPLNKDGGERRLNVLITRAKIKCVVFSNITSHDINLSKTNALGVAALKRFLEYAQNRVLFKLKSSDNETDDFIDYLYQKLLEYGYEVDKNIGRNVGIDLAIFDKELNRFTVGIECDGGTYKNIDNATDRERIRRNVLRSLGWKLYHIWTPDYYRNPKNEFDQLLEYISQANKDQEESATSSAPTLNIKRKKNEKIKEEDLVLPYKIYQGPKRRSTVFEQDDSLKNLIVKILNCEAPLHLYILKKRLQDLTGVNKLNSQQVENINKQIKLLDDFELREDFIYKKDEKIKFVRDRHELDISSRKTDYIPDEEIILSIYHAMNKGAATEVKELTKVITEFFGFNKNNKLNERIVKILDQLIEDGKLYLDENILFIKD